MAELCVEGLLPVGTGTPLENLGLQRLPAGLPTGLREDRAARWEPWVGFEGAPQALWSHFSPALSVPPQCSWDPESPRMLLGCVLGTWTWR